MKNNRDSNHISFLNKYKYSILLLAIIFLVIANNFIWIRNSKGAPIGNALQDLFPGINFYLDMVQGRISFGGLFKGIFRIFSFTSTFPVDWNNYIRFQFFIYPPLPPLSYAAFYFIFGPHAKIELMANTIYLAIAMISIYGIGKKISDRKSGLLAAFILSTFPGVIGFSRHIYAEFILMCVSCLMLFFLLKTDNFKNRGYSLLFGISLGLAALTKWEFLLIVGGPVLWYLGRLSFSEDNCRRNFLLAALVGLLMSFVWYSMSINDIIWRLFYGPDSILLQRYSASSFGSFLIQKASFYILAIINTFIGLFYFLLLLLAGIIMAFKANKDKGHSPQTSDYRFYAVFIILWIAVPYLFLSLANLQTASHVLLVLPALALIVGLGIFSLKNVILRSALIFLIVLYGMGSYLHSFVDFGKLDALYKLKIYLSPDLRLALTTATDNIPRDEWGRNHFYPPDTRNWKINEIISFVKEDSRLMHPRPVVLVLGNKEEFNSFSFQYYNLLWGEGLFIEPRSNDRSKMPKDRSKFDYVVIKSDFETIDGPTLSQIVKITCSINKDLHNPEQFKKDFFDKYKLIREYLLPDNTKGKIYKLVSS